MCGSSLWCCCIALRYVVRSSHPFSRSIYAPQGRGRLEPACISLKAEYAVTCAAYNHDLKKQNKTKLGRCERERIKIRMQSFVFTNDRFTRCLSQYRSGIRPQFQHDYKNDTVFPSRLEILLQNLCHPAKRIIHMSFSERSVSRPDDSQRISNEFPTSKYLFWGWSASEQILWRWKFILN